ncbi:hypothetical protein [Reyranella soli]|nr:hypothetical protein [Reyranella soli]
MQDANPSAPDNVTTSFALPTSSTGGHGHGIVVESCALAWTVGSLVRRRTFDDIAAMELELERSAEEPFVRCDILFTEGECLGMLIELNRAKDIAIYRAFVTELFERLGPAQRQRIIFREGASPASRVLSIVLCVVLLLTLLGVLLFGVASGAFFEEENAWLGIPLVLLFVFVLSGILRRTLKSEQKTYDPETLSQRCLP